MKLSIDLETRSRTDLKTRGSYVYFEDPSTKILIAAYRVDDRPPRIWTYDQPPPEDLFEAFRAGAEVHGFNIGGFEALAFAMMAKRHGWPEPSPEQYHDTQAMAVAMGLPRSLDGLAAALGLPIQKDKEGVRLIRKFSVPKSAGGAFNEPEDHKADFELFKNYCLRDVDVEMAAARRLIPLSDDERKVWLLNQVVNRRGVRIDTVSARAAIELTEKAVLKLNDELKDLTKGRVHTATQVKALTGWVFDQGVPIEKLAKKDVTELLAFNDLPPQVRRAVEIREEAGKTSVAKLKSFLLRASSDDRVHGAFLYHGASTGRESSTGVNLANMPRPRRIYEDAHLDVSQLFEAFRSKDPDMLPMLYGRELGRPMHLVSDSIRGFVWAAEGEEFIAADYSGIEGAVTAWLADETWKLEALHEIKRDPTLPDLYRRTAAKIMGLTTDVVTKKNPLRQSVGKTSELALGFGGGVAAFASMANTYNVDLDALYEPIAASAPPEVLAAAGKRYERCLKARDKVKTDVLSRRVWVACESIKRMWRAENAKIEHSWRDQGDAMRNAIRFPGEKFTAGRVSYLVKHGFLFSRLPSGRCLAYGAPKLRDQVYATLLIDGEWVGGEVLDREKAEKLVALGQARIDGDAKPAASALGVNSTTKKYERFSLYDGLNYENLVQAIARDLLINGMRKAEAEGYKIVFTVYDEIVAEVPRGFGSCKGFEDLICELPAWADGMPLQASAWRGKRYKKG